MATLRSPRFTRRRQLRAWYYLQTQRRNRQDRDESEDTEE